MTEKLSFGQLLKISSKTGEIVTCPKGTCGGKTGSTIRELFNCPDIVTIGITWESNSMGDYAMNDFYKFIGTSFEIQDVNIEFIELFQQKK